MSVGAFDDDMPLSLQSYVLREYYRGLHIGGFAQLLIMNRGLEGRGKLFACLEHNDIPFNFIESDQRVVEPHGFGDPKRIYGTLTMGPKSLN